MKKIGIILVIIIAVPLIVALFVRKEYSVEREITIHKSRQEVFAYIKQIKNQENYSTWSMADPYMKKEYRGTDGTVGFVSVWESENKEVGKGEQEIKKIVDGERIEMELRFVEPFVGTSPAYMATETIADNTTKVKWGFSGQMSYPMNLMLLFFDVEETLGKNLDAGLSNLKNILEK